MQQSRHDPHRILVEDFTEFEGHGSITSDVQRISGSGGHLLEIVPTVT